MQETAAAIQFAGGLHPGQPYVLASYDKEGRYPQRFGTYLRAGDSGSGFIAENARYGLGTSVLITQTVAPIFRAPDPSRDIKACPYVGVKVSGPASAITDALPQPTALLTTQVEAFAVWKLSAALPWEAALALARTLAGRCGGEEAFWAPLPCTRRGGAAVSLEWLHKGLEYAPDRLRQGQEMQEAVSFDASAIAIKPQEWLWPSIIPLGTLVLLGGMGGMGKSQIAIDIAARVSAGHRWPSGEPSAAAYAVVWEAEDDMERTVAPRLLAANADMSRVKLGGRNRSGGIVDLSFGIEALTRVVDGLPAGSVVVLSPLRKFFAAVDLAGDIAVRDALQLLVDYAERRRITILGVMHPPKEKEHKEAFGGSAAYFNLARAALSCIPDPTSKEKIVKRRPRIIVPAKGNLGPDQDSLHYRIVGVTLANGIGISRVEWQDAPDTHARLALPRPTDVPAWLTSKLRDGPRPTKEFEEEARLAGINRTNFYQHLRDMGAIYDKDGFQGRSTVRLP